MNGLTSAPPSDFNARLVRAASVARFGIHDVARWFGVSASCARYWLNAESSPSAFRRAHMGALLDLLEEAAPGMTLGMERFGRWERIAYVDETRNALISQANSPKPGSVLPLLEGDTAQDSPTDS